MKPILLALESAPSRAPQLVDSRLLNFISEKEAPEVSDQIPLFGAPGISTKAVVGTGPHRGSWEFNGVAYYVSGNQLWTVSQSGLATLLGDGIGGSQRVSMSDNGVQLCIVNGISGWIYDTTTGFQQITSVNFYPANTVIFMDGYFIFNRIGTNQWFLSELYDGLTYNGLDFAVAEGQSGFVMAAVQNLQLLFIFTSSHIEMWYDAGTASFPFQRYSGGIINYSTISPHSIVKQDGAIFFLGADKVFYRLQANVALRVSTHAIETAIEKADEISDVFTTTYTWEGHKIINMTIPSTSQTFSYDISTGRWHERNSVDAEMNDLGQWRGSTMLSVYNETYVGDGLSGNIGIIDWGTYTEFGNPIFGMIQSVNQRKDRLRIFCGGLELNGEAGVGQTNDPGSDPQIMLQRSIDGGRRWGIIQHAQSMGKRGDYEKRVRFMRQGAGRQMMWRIIITDPVPRTVIGAYADIKFGMA